MNSRPRRRERTRQTTGARRCWLTLAIVVIGVAATPVPLFAHAGRTNSEGCHTERKTGDYHCHGRARAADRPASSRASKTTTTDRNVGVYANCTAARAAGASPVRRGDPGYGPHLDRDDDGIGCE